MQTPPSIEERNSTVAKKTERGNKQSDKRRKCVRLHKGDCSNKVENEFGVLRFETIVGMGGQRVGKLRLFNNPRAFYQHTTDQETV